MSSAVDAPVREPFGSTADPAAYVPFASTERALAGLQRSVGEGRGAAALLGPPGLGKTLLLRVLADRERVLRPCYVPFSSLGPNEFCALALDMLGRPADGDPGAELERHAAGLAAAGSGVLLLVDDAGSLPEETTARLARLVEASGGALRLVMAAVDGEPARRALGAFGEVDLVRLTQGMNAEEAPEYVARQLELAGDRGALAAVFSDAMVETLHRRSGGVVRRFNHAAQVLVREARGERAPELPGAPPAASRRPVPAPPTILEPPPPLEPPSILERPRSVAATRSVERPPSVEPPHSSPATPPAPAASPPSRAADLVAEEPDVAQLLEPPSHSDRSGEGDASRASGPSAAGAAREAGSYRVIRGRVVDPATGRPANDRGAREATAGAPPRAEAPAPAAAGSDRATPVGAAPPPADRPPRRVLEVPPRPRAVVEVHPRTRREKRLAAIAAGTLLVASLALGVWYGRSLDSDVVAPVRERSAAEAVATETRPAAAKPLLLPQAAAVPEAEPRAGPEVAAVEPSAPPTPRIELLAQPVPPVAPPARELTPPRPAPEPIAALPEPPSPEPVVARPAPEAPEPLAPPAPTTSPAPIARPAPPEPAPAPIARPAPAEPTPAPTTPPAPIAAPVPPPTVAVAINATPWAEIEVDGRNLGETPLAGIPLEVGEHVFRARMPDGSVRERRLRVDESHRRIVFE